ncbi:hypothetical protein GQ55_9G403600 [Panicum hallii var. hallii]|uniref:Uncharacterized protein n=1 Tax=Panicum hallii var. hallii TaxID=1504633 RepID=A0A2T7CA17_9POAL|nr:hypothetical protein GQ55_9G403600 [Panicum hallii var. hallii]
MYRELSLVLLTFILRFMNDGHPRRRGAANPGRRMPRTRPARRRRLAHGLRREDARVTLDPERIRKTGSDPGAGPSSSAPASSPLAVADLGPTSPAPALWRRPPLTRGDGWLCPPSPSPERVAERLRASETPQPLRPLRYCPLHGWGPCPARTAAEPPPPATGSGAPTAGEVALQPNPTRPSDEAGPSGTSSPPLLLSPSGNRVIRRLAYHLSPRPRPPGSWALTAHMPEGEGDRERSRSPPRRRL